MKMKKLLLILIMAVVAISVSAAVTYSVTVPAGTNACYIAGAMNKWTPQAMTKVTATTYTITIETAKVSDTYKYCSGPGWGYVEVTATGGEVANRTYAANDVVAKWALVYDPGVLPVDVAYNVTVPTGTKACYIAGPMTNWTFTAMTKLTETTYTITINTATPDNYKFASGPEWKYEELTSTGGAVANRIHAANDTVAKWTAVYDSTIVVKGVTYKVTVPMGTKECYIAGTMTSWKQAKMTKVTETTYTLNIDSAKVTDTYKYCSGPEWKYVEVTAAGGKVADRTYAANDVVAKWAAVYTDTTIVVKGVTYNVTVPAGTKACYIAGAMTNWTPIAMTKVTETTYTLKVDTAEVTDTYKYCSGPSWGYVEVTATGTEVANRTYTANDVVAKWSMVYDPGVQPVDVVYNVTVPAGTNMCYIAGAMTGWAFTAMTKLTETTYTITINTATPDNYKYASGPDWKYEELTSTGGIVANRTYAANDVVATWTAVYTPTAIWGTQESDIKIISGNSELSIELVGKATVSVYTLQGVLVKNASFENTIKFDNLSTGLYLLKVNNKTYKTIVK